MIDISTEPNSNKDGNDGDKEYYCSGYLFKHKLITTLNQLDS